MSMKEEQWRQAQEMREIQLRREAEQEREQLRREILNVSEKEGSLRRYIFNDSHPNPDLTVTLPRTVGERGSLRRYVFNDNDNDSHPTLAAAAEVTCIQSDLHYM